MCPHIYLTLCLFIHNVRSSGLQCYNHEAVILSAGNIDLSMSKPVIFNDCLCALFMLITKQTSKRHCSLFNSYGQSDELSSIRGINTDSHSPHPIITVGYIIFIWRDSGLNLMLLGSFAKLRFRSNIREEPTLILQSCN